MKTKLRGITGQRRIVAGVLMLALFAGTVSVWAQKKSSVRRSKFNKQELEKRAKELAGDYPRIKSAAGSSEGSSREEIKRRALRIVDEAMSKDLKKAEEAEARRIAEGADVTATRKEAAEKMLTRVRSEAPADVRARLEKAREIVPAAEPSAPAGKSTGNWPDFNGYVTKTADGKTLKVPGIQVASTFTGEAVPVTGNGPAPGPKPAPRAPKSKDGKEVEINCTGGAIFSSTGEPDGNETKGGKEKPPIIIFEENVTVAHPDFYIDCDKLIAYMKKSPEKKEVGAGAPAAKPVAPAEEEGGIERAIATGREVVVRKKASGGKVKIGKARKVTYDSRTGDVTLEDWPQVQDGQNVQMATKRDVIMVLKPDGRMVADGPTRTVIVPKGPEDPLVPAGN